MSGYSVDETGGREGGRAILLDNETLADGHAAMQVIELNQTEPRPLKFSAWSKPLCITGEPDDQYSIYLDIRFMDGSDLFGETLHFPTSLPEWTYREGFVFAEKPIQHVRVHLLLRWSHVGKVLFDDFSLFEIPTDPVFDFVHVSTQRPDPIPYDGELLSLTTDDGLTVGLTAEGGALTQVDLSGQSIVDPNFDYCGGFLVRDVAAQGDIYHVGGACAQDGDTITHVSRLDHANLDFDATYTCEADRITIHAEVTDTSGSERALTVYLALPIRTDGEWRWGKDILEEQPLDQSREYAHFSKNHRGLGATGLLSSYPWASLSGPEGGLAASIPLDTPCAMRLAYSPSTSLLYAAWDFGLSPQASQIPGRAWLDVVLYRFDPEGGFRAAAQGYYDRFPTAFARRIPPDREGIWIPFCDLCEIPGVEDLGIGFHEIGDLSRLACDEELGVLSFHYLSEPWSVWLKLRSRPLLNPDFEDGLNHWLPYDPVFPVEIDEFGGRCGGQALKLLNSVSPENHSAFQEIVLDQAEAKAIYWRGWSRAEGVDGVRDNHYSLWTDVYHRGDPQAYAHILPFEIGTHGWELQEGWILAERPIYSLRVHCLLRWTHTGTAYFDDLELWEIDEPIEKVNAAYNSGFFDQYGACRYKERVVPWCPGAAGCAVFTVNPDPDVDPEGHPPNKAHLELTEEMLDTYRNTPELDGVYLDSYLAHATVMDFRTAHWAAANTPLTYQTGDWRVGTPQVFATTEYARWVRETIPERLYMMANWVLRGLPWGTDIFDVFGTEIDWINDYMPEGERWEPDGPSTLAYYRTLAYQRPYCLTLNTDLDNLTAELMQAYFNLALFWGLYPSVFSQDAATDPYCERLALIERDRELFKKYIPIIRRLNQAGWQPRTHATTSDARVLIERFGGDPSRYPTLHNTHNQAIRTEVTLEAEAWGLPADGCSTAISLLTGSRQLLVSGRDPGTLVTSIDLDGSCTEVYTLSPGCSLYLPYVPNGYPSGS